MHIELKTEGHIVQQDDRKHEIEVGTDSSGTVRNVSKRQFKGIPEDTPLYFALIKYVANRESSESEATAKISHQKGVTTIDISIADKTSKKTNGERVTTERKERMRIIYNIAVVGQDVTRKPVVEEDVMIVVPNGNTGRYAHEEMHVKSIAGEIGKDQIESSYCQLESRCSKLSDRYGEKVVARDGRTTDKEWPSVQKAEEDKTPVTLKVPPQYMGQIGGRFEDLFDKTPVRETIPHSPEFNELLEDLKDSQGVRIAEGIRRISLTDISQCNNPVTDSAYSQFHIENKMMMTLVACIDNLTGINYDRFIAVPPSTSMKIALDLGSKKMLEQYLSPENKPLNDGERARLLHRLDRSLRKDLPIEAIEQYLEERGRTCIRMSDYCTFSSDDLHVYEMGQMTPSRIFKLFPKQGVVAFYTQYGYLLNELIEFIMDNRGTRLSKDVVDAENQVLRLEDLTVHLVGPSVRTTAREYMTGEHQVVRWRHTDDYPQVVLPQSEVGTPALSQMIENYLNDDT